MDDVALITLLYAALQIGSLVLLPKWWKIGALPPPDRLQPILPCQLVDLLRSRQGSAAVPAESCISASRRRATGSWGSSSSARRYSS